MKKPSHFSSKKFTMTVFGVVVVFILYFVSAVLLILYGRPEQTVAFTAMFKDTMMVLSIIVGALVGVQGVVDYKFGGSTVGLQSITETIVNVIETSKKDDDYELN